MTSASLVFTVFLITVFGVVPRVFPASISKQTTTPNVALQRTYDDLKKQVDECMSGVRLSESTNSTVNSAGDVRTKPSGLDSSGNLSKQVQTLRQILKGCKQNLRKGRRPTKDSVLQQTYDSLKNQTDECISSLRLLRRVNSLVNRDVRTKPNGRGSNGNLSNKLQSLQNKLKWCKQALSKILPTTTAIQEPPTTHRAITYPKTMQAPMKTSSATTQSPVYTLPETTQPPVNTFSETTQPPVYTLPETTQPPLNTLSETKQSPVYSLPETKMPPVYTFLEAEATLSPFCSTI